jgi:MFS transporter, ACS family, tartrate transporter
VAGDEVFHKCAWRLLPLVVAAYLANYLDRTTVGFAALRMNRDLGFSPSVYGFGAGVFFLSYALFMLPSNLVLHRVGGRRWFALLLVAWGASAAANALIQGAASFYALRLLLGVAEAGFFPGIIFYLTLWFPKAYIGRANAVFMCATSGSLVLGGPLASVILGFDGAAGLHGWQWLFLLEGLPSCLIGIAVLAWLSDEPSRASWLNDEERRIVTSRIGAEASAKQQDAFVALRDPRVIMLGVAYAGLLLTGYGFQFWLPLLMQGMGFSIPMNGLIVALIYAAQIPAILVWGRASDRHGERIWHVALGALFGAAALVVASVTHSTFLALVAITAAGVSEVAVLAPFYSISSSFLSGRAMAVGYAVVNTLGNLLGGFGGQYAIGILRERSGGYVAVFVVLSAALVLSAILVLAVGRSVSHRVARISAPAE